MAGELWAVKGRGRPDLTTLPWTPPFSLAPTGSPAPENIIPHPGAASACARECAHGWLAGRWSRGSTHGGTPTPPPQRGSPTFKTCCTSSVLLPFSGFGPHTPLASLHGTSVGFMLPRGPHQVFELRPGIRAAILAENPRNGVHTRGCPVVHSALVEARQVEEMDCKT